MICRGLVNCCCRVGSKLTMGHSLCVLARRRYVRVIPDTTFGLRTNDCGGSFSSTILPSPAHAPRPLNPATAATHRTPRLRAYPTIWAPPTAAAPHYTAAAAASTDLALEGAWASRHREGVPEAALACRRPLRLPPRPRPLLSSPGSPGCALPHASSCPLSISTSSPFLFCFGERPDNSTSRPGHARVGRWVKAGALSVSLWPYTRCEVSRTPTCAQQKQQYIAVHTQGETRPCAYIRCIHGAKSRRIFCNREIRDHHFLHCCSLSTRREPCRTLSTTTPNGSRLRWRRWFSLPDDARSSEKKTKTETSRRRLLR